VEDKSEKILSKKKAKSPLLGRGVGEALVIQVALTQMRARPKQTIVAALGVTFGIAMFVFMMSFMTGLNDLTNNIMLSVSPHVHVYNDIQTQKASITDEVFNSPQAFNVLHHPKPKATKPNLRSGLQIMELIAQDPRVADVAPMLNTQVFYNYGVTPIGGVISGVDILAEDRLFQLRQKLLRGTLEELLTTNNGILMGVGLAKKMNVDVGDKVNITTPDGSQFLLNIAGIFQTGLVPIDESKSYATLNTVQKLLNKDNQYITDINLKLKDLDTAPSVAADYGSRFGYKAEDWQTANASVQLGNTLRNFITYAVVFTLLSVAGFGIYNILTMMIYEKMKDIAILKAMGFSGGDVMRIFLSQALTIGVLGGSVGLLLGFLMAYGVSQVPFKADAFVTIDHLPVNFKPIHYISAFLFGLFVTTLAGFLPSRKASKVDPVEIIRGQ
jgi:lipoprotein-releasing system permease protein